MPLIFDSASSQSDAARDGVKEALEAAGYKEGENLKFIYESAQGNPATAAQIARQFVGEDPTVIVPISTPSAQAVVSATKDIPVVFTAVSDPLGAQLVTDQIVTDRVINELMGKDPSARFRFIMERAEEAEELDV